MSKTMNDAYGQIKSVIDEYLRGYPDPKTVVINNVGFKEILKLYGVIPEDKKTLFLPGEIGYENITVIYQPTEIFKFIIHSEPCIDYRWKVHQTKLNIN